MKWYPTISLLGVLGLVACSDAPTSPAAQESLRPSLALVYKGRDEFSGVVTGCPGSEDVFLNVKHSFTGTQTTDGSGRLHVSGHILYTFSGTGLISGREYVGSQQMTLAFNVLPGSGNTVTELFGARLIAKGAGPALTINAVTHITVTPDGAITSEISSIRQVC